jgi:hypothetical protein
VESIDVPDIAHEAFYPGIPEFVEHIKLLLFVPAKNNHLLGFFVQCSPKEGGAECPGSAGYQDSFSFK